MENNYTRLRFKEIISVAIKHGLRNGVGNPSDLRLVLEELGPTFVKIGQILSTRSDIFPKEYILELEKLQNNVKPEDFNIMKKIIEENLSGNISDIFLDFQTTPLASASLAEVYLAKLKTGEQIVLKVQRPLAKEKILADIRILRKLSPFIKFTTKNEFFNIDEVVEEIQAATEKELDFLNEKENIKKFNLNNKDIKYIKDIKIYEKYCTSTMIVMEYINGIKIDDTSRLVEDGYDTREVAKKLTFNYFKQIFEDGFFHGDPHPGNILVHNNKIGFIDFGLMGNLNLGLKKKFNLFLEGVATNNVDLMTSSILSIGIKKDDIDINNLYQDITLLYNTYINESMYEYDLAQILEEVIITCRKNKISMPKDVIFLAKGILTLQGVLAKIDKDLNIMDIAIPYFKSKIIEEKLKDFDISLLGGKVLSVGTSFLDLPLKLLQLIDRGLEGRLKLNLQFKNIDENFNEINKMVNRVIFSVMVAGLLVSSSLVINANAGLKVYGISAIGIVGYLGAGLAGFWLLISILKSGKL
ncbi:lipopolysaccharide core heptose(II) kinase RfaY [Tissierella sp. MB52-C2]|uniref:ABC1 kinase family protein n=1 Tax=Tissierella sp. MB52-C2 TaxID=3070999 RepID=UPI00280B2D65|nr:lipopolysaccharide core heptose(II) kinase RfaY [Tissierella sp. MB52-C2]WMM24560.1 lipopolysaccharide core heptose(II) kinase RfaY [Tissierella sp. MB52-C2]